MKYILQIKKIYYIERNEHTVGYSKICKEIAENLTIINYMAKVRAMFVEWDESVEGDRRKKIVDYVKSETSKHVNVTDFSFDVMIYPINDNTGKIYLDGFGSQTAYIEPKQSEISE